MENYDIFADYLTSRATSLLSGTGITLFSAKDSYSYVFEALLPGRIRCRFRMVDDNMADERFFRMIEDIKEFFLTDYLESGLGTSIAANHFLTLPGDVIFLDEKERPVLQYRLAMISAQDIFGSRNIRKAEFINEGSLVLHTREGRFTIRTRDFKSSLKETLSQMSHYMRKPIRKRYNKEICKEKKSEQG